MGEITLALAGNPNVGKSTVFNALTGMNQHTGNWPGKTVANATGKCKFGNDDFTLVDIPGTYSLFASSPEEEVARDFICFGNPDATVVVVDATCLERNLNLVLQILEVTKNVVVCVNLLDEAKKKGISVDLDELSLQLGVPVVGTCARSNEGVSELLASASDIVNKKFTPYVRKIAYPSPIEDAIRFIEISLEDFSPKTDSRWLALRLIDTDEEFNSSIKSNLEIDLDTLPLLKNKIVQSQKYLDENGIPKEFIRDELVSSIMRRAEEIYVRCVKIQSDSYNSFDRKLDKLFTSKATGIPVMLLLLAFIFWITIVGANYPSAFLSRILFGFQNTLYNFLHDIYIPDFIANPLVFGIYRTVAWVVSVMLPPMAIFFPIFTLLEDSGYLPRVAFNMDKYFKKACAHGKQSLTMCMGFGCNACGVTGCRIIDSPRERLIAILTNNFVPCNGRFPTLISIISMFFVTSLSFSGSIMSAILLTLVILLGIFTTLVVSKLLSSTLLKGIPSSFILELPSYRAPQFGKVIVRSIFDRTLFVLGRAVAVAAPAGLLIWILANVPINGISVLTHFTTLLNPFAQIIGLDGVILAAFILGLPANEIVVPIILMAYMSTGNLAEYSSLMELKNILVTNNWTWVTALCTMLFSLFHFPCATTLWTIKKETQSWKWTAVAFLIPTVIGIVVCGAVNLISLFL